MGRFLLASLSLGHLHPSVTVTFLIYVSKFALTKLLSNGSGVNIPKGSSFFYNSIYLLFKFPLYHSFFYLLNFHFTLLANFLFQLFIFSQMSSGFITGKQSYKLCCLCVQNTKSAITSHWQTSKEIISLTTYCDAYLLLVKWWVNPRARSSLYLHDYSQVT